MRRNLTPALQRDDYLRLVRIFPLRKLRTEAEHAEALKISGKLIGRDRKLTHGESEYLGVLAMLIQEFERSRQDNHLPRASGIDVLKHLMAEHAMTQKQLAHLLGVGESAASMILSGTRELTKSHIDKLSQHFGVGVGAFF
jgi:HTH-type transcriptional regulator/antitoxin HigA